MVVLNAIAIFKNEIQKTIRKYQLQQNRRASTLRANFLFVQFDEYDAIHYVQAKLLCAEPLAICRLVDHGICQEQPD